MEPIKDTLRIIVNLGKYQVIQVDKGATGVSFTLALPNSVKLTADLSIAGTDVRLGDWLTLYTEVLTHAIPTSTSKQ